MYIDLDDVDDYSEEATIAAFRDYYTFLTKLYLGESVILEPPEDGWPDINAESLQGLNKSDDVLSLLRRLPYIEWKGGFDGPCVFTSRGRSANWAAMARMKETDLKACSEGDLDEHVPSHVFGLTWGGLRHDILLLDTQLGVIYSHECPNDVSNNACREMVDDDPRGMLEDGECSEEEAEWRGDSKRWALADFFEVLKDQFRKLCWIPVRGGEQIIEVGENHYGGETEVMLQDIFREHGWPNLDEFDKAGCDKAVRSAMQQKFPDDVLWRP